MAHGMTRREFGIAAGAATLAAAGFKAKAQSAGAKTLRFIPQTDVQVLDPIWTTAYVTRNHGYMVFDTLFAIDSKFRPQPANGRRVRDLAGQAPLQFRAARRPQIP